MRPDIDAIADLGARIAAAKAAEVVTFVDNQRPDVATSIARRFEVFDLCPVSKNPQPGSWLELRYIPAARLLEIESLKAYIAAFRHGRLFPDGAHVRDLEHVPQRIAADCAGVLLVPVQVVGTFHLEPVQVTEIDVTAQP